MTPHGKTFLYMATFGKSGHKAVRLQSLMIRSGELSNYCSDRRCAPSVRRYSESLAEIWIGRNLWGNCWPML